MLACIRRLRWRKLREKLSKGRTTWGFVDCDGAAMPLVHTRKVSAGWFFLRLGLIFLALDLLVLGVFLTLNWWNQ